MASYGFLRISAFLPSLLVGSSAAAAEPDSRDLGLDRVYIDTGTAVNDCARLDYPVGTPCYAPEVRDIYVKSRKTGKQMRLSVAVADPNALLQLSQLDPNQVVKPTPTAKPDASISDQGSKAVNPTHTTGRRTDHPDSADAGEAR